MAQYARIPLTSQERKRLQAIAKSKDEPAKVGLRATIMLMSSQQVPAKTIGEGLGVGLRTVYLIRRRWRREGFDGLYDSPRPGRPSQATKAYLRKMFRTVETDPRDLGYAFSRWSSARLAEYMKQQTGVDLSAKWVSGLLKRNGFVWRKSKLTIRNLQSEREKNRAQKLLRRLQRAALHPEADFGTETACGSTFCRSLGTCGAGGARAGTSRPRATT